MVVLYLIFHKLLQAPDDIRANAVCNLFKGFLHKVSSVSQVDRSGQDALAGKGVQAVSLLYESNRFSSIAKDCELKSCVAVHLSTAGA
jgi:hypothetical protein